MTYYYFYTKNGMHQRIESFEYVVDTHLNPCWDPLTQEQTEFYLEHPTASIREVEKCEMDPPYIPPTPSIEELREEALKEIDSASRETIGVFVDTLGFANAVATSMFSKAKGITPIYDDAEILATATDFLEKGKLCRQKMQEMVPLIEQAETLSDIEALKSETLAYFESIQRDEDNIEKHRSRKLQEIDVYDNSDNVNGFYYNGNFMWLDKSTRVGLVNTLDSAEEMGRETVNIWYNNQVCIELDVPTARLVLAAIELYATDCYNVTAQHKKSVAELSTIEEIDNFDITAGYPDMLRFGEN